MKNILFSLLLFGLLKNASAQVSGRLDTENGLPIAFANVLLLKSSDTTLVKAILTKENGTYTFENIPKGKYILRLGSSGYRTWESPVFELTDLQKSKDFGSRVIAEKVQELGEVIVRAEKPLYLQKPEGTIINVESSLLTKGSSALEVLERSPGVVVNHRDNSIEINGKSGVAVMLNGKPVRMSMEQVVGLLNGMSADNISTIELLTTPPARYDAEGSAGLVNIVLKKNKKQGTNGSVSLTGGYGYREKETASLNLSHNTGKLDIHGSYAFSHNSTYHNMNVISSQNMSFLGGQTEVFFLDTTTIIQNNHNATIGLDVKPNPKTTFGANITYNNTRSSGATINNAAYNVLPDSLLQFTGENKGINHWNNLVSSIYIEKVTGKSGKINIDLDYLSFNNKANSAVKSSFINKHGSQAGNDEILFSPHQKGEANTTIQVGVAKIDFTKQLAKKITFEAGAKGAYTQSTSISGIQSFINGAWATTDQTSNNIIMKEQIGALYASVNTQIDQSTILTAGARYEYSNTNMYNFKTGGNIAKRRLASFFPSIFFSKKINPASEFQLSYTKRIARPSYNDLASYVGYSDPTAVYTGNPFLKPTITNNIKLGYNHKSYSFSLLFSRDDNAITRYQLTESPLGNMLFISPQNLTWQNNITFQTSLPWKLSNWWTMNYVFAGGLRQYKVTYTKYSFEKSYFGYSFSFNQAFKLPRNFSTEFSGVYNSLSFDGSKRVGGFGVLNAGVKKELKKNKGSFQLSVADILRTERYIIDYGTLTHEAFSIKSHVAFYPESARSPIIKLSYSKSFGNNKTKVQRNTEANDEQKRVISER